MERDASGQIAQAADAGRWIGRGIVSDRRLGRGHVRGGLRPEGLREGQGCAERCGNPASLQRARNHSENALGV